MLRLLTNNPHFKTTCTYDCIDAIGYLQLVREREEELSQQAAAEAEKRKPKSRKEEPTFEPKAFTSGVGKYINPTTMYVWLDENMVNRLLLT